MFSLRRNAERRIRRARSTTAPQLAHFTTLEKTPVFAHSAIRRRISDDLRKGRPIGNARKFQPRGDPIRKVEETSINLDFTVCAKTRTARTDASDSLSGTTLAGGPAMSETVHAESYGVEGVSTDISKRCRECSESARIRDSQKHPELQRETRCRPRDNSRSGRRPRAVQH